MTLLSRLVQSTAANALGWTLVHSLWEGALIALALAALLSAVRSSRLRYAAACVAMLSLLAMALSTFAYLLPLPEARATSVIGVPGPASILGLNEGRTAADAATKPGVLEFLPWLAPIWLAGVVIFQLRTLAGCFVAQRLRHRGVCCPSGLWQQRLDALGGILRVSRPVRLLESCMAEVPVVIGYIRPLILMPVGLMANLSVRQVESILLHELAHIRRYDYVVNLLQISVEGLLFYHPALWWISGVIRAERENCCDDLVIAIRGNAYEYATALAALEEHRWVLQQAALAATGGHLMKRIRRLLGQAEHNNHLGAVFSAGLLTVAAAVTLAAWQAKPALTALTNPVKLAAQANAAVATNSAFDLWMNEDVAYIISDAERLSFQSLRTNLEREQFIEQFWNRREPVRAVPGNEFKQEHYRRLAYANDRYGADALPGWKSDRGRIYITWGPPDEIESHPSGGKQQRPPEQGGGTTTTFPFEQWLYRGIPRAGVNTVIEFVDRSGSGEYAMIANPNRQVFLSAPPGALSAPPGARAYVLISPERRMSPGIPLDFEAKLFTVKMSVRTSAGLSVLTSQSVVGLCKDWPQDPGCLQLPVFEPIENSLLEPGSYLLEATVSDGAGLTTRSYAVNFAVK